MCTLVILRRPGHDWPVVIGANRDEMAGRPWRGPGRHWPDRPEVTAGQDELAGGTWLGLNEHGFAYGRHLASCGLWSRDTQTHNEKGGVPLHPRCRLGPMGYPF